MQNVDALTISRETPRDDRAAMPLGLKQVSTIMRVVMQQSSVAGTFPVGSSAR
jgi:hypothetical protein